MTVPVSASVSQATMRAGVITTPRRGVIRHTIPVPDPQPGQVRLRVEGCGVCGSNLPVWEGRPWFTYPLEPGAPGHEAWGVIEAVGDGVNDLEIGDRVAALSYHGFAEYDIADASAVVELPERLGGQPFPGEALGCAMNVMRRCDIQAGQHVAIIGIGFLGALLTQLAVAAGAKVTAVSRRRFALGLAKQFGAMEAIEFADREQIASRIQKITGGRGSERVIEAVGHQNAIDLATDIVAERGRLIIAGYHQDGQRQVNMQQWNWRGIDVINAHERDPSVYVRGMEEAVRAVINGRLDPTPLYTHTFSIDELPEAFATAEARPDGFMKALVMP
jgi:threonine dehydrogenase-like Zn-dependent dehydrogenase